MSIVHLIPKQTALNQKSLGLNRDFSKVESSFQLECNEMEKSLSIILDFPSKGVPLEHYGRNDDISKNDRLQQSFTFLCDGLHPGQASAYLRSYFFRQCGLKNR